MVGEILVHFNKTVDDYDVVADKVVMKNRELQDTMIDLLQSSLNNKIKILDLGCGTWSDMKLILEKYPNTYVVWIDFSQKMIDKAWKNLEEYKDRIELIKADFTKLDFWNNQYDAIVSAVAIHNINHEAKIDLFNKIFHSLKKWWIFINWDFVEAETEQLDIHYRCIYKDFLENNLEWEVLNVWLWHAFWEDMPMSLTKQFKVLKRAGFSDIHLKWQFVNEAVYIAIK